MNVRRLLWSVAALLAMVGGFVVERVVLDDADDPAQENVEHRATEDETDAGADVDVNDEGASDAGADLPRFSDLQSIVLDDLPPEAIEVLQLIEDGGPYEYRQDDSVFQNREGILPDRPPGHYREYTVETPGSPDRGARRIVAGADGERYWTDDHYDSFVEIVF